MTTHYIGDIAEAEEADTQPAIASEDDLSDDADMEQVVSQAPGPQTATEMDAYRKIQQLATDAGESAGESRGRRRSGEAKDFGAAWRGPGPRQR